MEHFSRGTRVKMAECRQVAVLVITRDVEGTTTNVVRRRVTLSCGLPSGHEGAHQDLTQGENWDPNERDDRPTLVRHEADSPED
jgi:hypothetical protein